MAILLIGDRASEEYAALGRELEAEHELVVVEEAVQAARLLRERDWALVVLDREGEGLGAVLEAAGVAPVVVVLTRPTLEATLDAIEAGARDVQAPPLSAERLRDLALRPDGVMAAAPTRPASASIVGESAAMLQVYREVARPAASDLPVLLVGEAGTGKEMLGRVIHQRSARASGPFITVNCAAIPPAILEGELFGGSDDGHERKVGWITRADGGTLFLEEIGVLPGGLQVRLIRLLQTGQLRPDDAGTSRTVDVRIIAATDVDLQDAVVRQRFRGDLYYALAVTRIDVPPLRERAGDVRLLASHLLHELAGEARGSVRAIDEAALAALDGYGWPGNIRQLRAVLARALAVADGPVLRRSHLPPDIVDPAPGARPRTGEFLPLAELERLHIEEALKLTGGHLGQAARLLGIHRNTLRRKLETYQLPGR